MTTIQKKLVTIALSSTVAIGALGANPAEADTRKSIDRAVALARQGGFATALAMVERACRRAEVPECGHNRGILLAQLQRFDEAAPVGHRREHRTEGGHVDHGGSLPQEPGSAE